MRKHQKIPVEMVAKIIDLNSRAWTHRQIATELNLHPNTVYRYLRSYNRRVLARLVARGESEKGRQIAIYTRIAAEALAAWEVSRKPAVQQKKSSGGEGGDRTEKTVKGQSGAPQHLMTAMAALAGIQKLLGIDEAADGDGAAKALETLAGALETALGALPDAVRDEARQRVSDALLEANGNGRRHR